MEGKWTTAPLAEPGRRSGPARRPPGGCSLVLFRQSRAEGRRVAARRVPVASRAASRAVPAARATCRRGTTAWEESGLLDDPEYAAFHEQLENVRPAPPVPEWEQIVTGELVKTAEAVIGGGA